MVQTQKKTVYLIIVLIVAIVVALGIFVLIDRFSSNGSSDTAINVDLNNSNDFDWSKYETYTIELSESLEITQPGVYVLSGTITDGNVSINTDGNVKLELANVNITNSSGPAIYVANAKNVVISTTSGSKNTLVDGTNYNGYEADEIATIFSHDDLFLEGDGTLIVTANNADAIVSKDDLTFTSGTYQITSVDDGIRGKDSVYIESGNFTIKANGDGIKSTNATDEGRGYIYITNGQFNITAQVDGIQAETDLQIDGGDFTLATGDDGIHAGANLIINGGTINIAECYEGIEGATVVINDGKITVVATDDGFNAAGGNDASSLARPGANNFHDNDNNYIRIRGGTINIVSAGDSLDSNGKLYIDGGEITIFGPTNGADSAFDHDGDFIIAGGTIMASEVTGIMEGGISSSSTGFVLIVGFSTRYVAGTTVTVEDSNGTEVLRFASTKTFSSITFSSPDFEQDATYTIKVDGSTYTTVTLSSTVTQIGTQNSGGPGMMNMGGGHGPNGAQGPQGGPR